MAEGPQADVRALARLSRLKLAEEEAEALRAELKAILDSFERMPEAEVRVIAPPMDLPLRSDAAVLSSTDMAVDILNQAPRHEGHLILVPPPSTEDGG
jgi:aspartyl/glutamyl-tRNA(Asn/Gln) amidotransferase C subunit